MERAKEAVAQEIRKNVDNLSNTIIDELYNVLQGAEWEPVLCYALDPLIKIF